MYPAGTKDIPLGKVLAILVEDEEDIKAFADYKADESAAPTPAAAPKAEPAAAAAPSTPAPATPSQPKAAPAKPAGSRIFASPLAQNLANEKGVSLASIQGTGPNGRIIKADVMEAKVGGGAPSTPVIDTLPSAAFVDLENSNIRKVIADRLTFSKQNIPHYYVTV